MQNLAAANTGKVVLPGLADPLGAHCVDGGVNFSGYSRDAIGMELVLFGVADYIPTHILDMVRHYTARDLRSVVPLYDDLKKPGSAGECVCAPSTGVTDLKDMCVCFNVVLRSVPANRPKDFHIKCPLLRILVEVQRISSCVTFDMMC
jgi:hypothetical protein